MILFFNIKYIKKESSIFRLGWTSTHDDINVYNKNEPLKLSANIVWQKQELGNSFIGVNFKDMNVQQQKGIKSCLDFFNNSI